jgi:hypothetical protein
MTSLRIFSYKITKTGKAERVLSTRDTRSHPYKSIKLKEIYIEEMGFSARTKGLTEVSFRSIVEEVPRGLRNSQPAKT